jgi:acetyl esterase
MTLSDKHMEILRAVRAAGPVIDPPAAKALYAPLLADMPRGAEPVRDLAYGDDDRHRLDVYPAVGVAGPAPVVVFLHGGGFIRGDKADREAVGHYFSRHGVVAVLPNYRLGPKHRWPAGAEDVASVLAWARANVAAHGGDPDHIVLAGESAGAAHVAAATLVSRFHPPEGLKIAGAFLASGVYNAELELLARAQLGIATPDPRNEAYFGGDFASYRAMSTVELVDAAPFPLAISTRNWTRSRCRRRRANCSRGSSRATGSRRASGSSRTTTTSARSMRSTAATTPWPRPCSPSCVTAA